MHASRTVLDGLGSSLETKKEISSTRVTTATNTDNTSPQEVKKDNAVDEKQTINHLSSNCHSLNSSHSHSFNDRSEHSSVIPQSRPLLSHINSALEPFPLVLKCVSC